MKLTKQDAELILRSVSTVWSPQNWGHSYNAEGCKCCRGEQIRKGDHRSVIRHTHGCLTVKLYNFVHGTNKRIFLDELTK